MPRPTDRIPDPPRSLDEERATELTATTEDALRRQRRALAASLAHALDHIPRPLRGTVRRALGL
jgi:hypothetical protein